MRAKDVAAPSFAAKMRYAAASAAECRDYGITPPIICSIIDIRAADYFATRYASYAVSVIFFFRCRYAPAAAGADYFSIMIR